MEIDILGMSNKEKREALREIYFEAGAGLFDSQHLEYGIKVMIYMLSQQNLWPYDFPAAEKIIEGKSKKTLGALVHILKGQGFLDDVIEDVERRARCAEQSDTQLPRG
jgi:hypothetical protein